MLIEISILGYLLQNIKYLKKSELLLIIFGFLLNFNTNEYLFLYILDILYIIYLIYIFSKIIKINNEVKSLIRFVSVILIIIGINIVYTLFIKEKNENNNKINFNGNDIIKSTGK